MMKVRYKTASLPFRHPFRISKGSKTHQPTFLVELSYFGYSGYGEAPAIAYYDITIEKMAADLEARKAFVEKFSFADPERYWHYLHHLFPQNPFLVCALDMAGWDLFGKMRRKPLHQLWQLTTETVPLTDYTIGLADKETMLEKLKAFPWPIYKIKVGTADDLAILAALRKETAAPFRVDANAGWSLETALELIPHLKDLGVELIEQPLAKDDREGMAKLFGMSPIPLIADEACVFEADVAGCVGLFHGINIKLTKCSGITPARRMIKQARELGLQVMLGCMNESTVGTAAIAQLAPLVDYVDMDGTLLLTEDLATGAAFDQGRYIYNDQPGLGISIAAFGEGQ